jgi:hypothetical protein
MSKTIVFWKDSEIKAAKTALNKIGSIPKTALWLAPKLRRPIGGVTAKLYEITKGVVPKRALQKKGKGIILPKGFQLNLDFKKATIYDGYLKLDF